MNAVGRSGAHGRTLRSWRFSLVHALVISLLLHLVMLLVGEYRPIVFFSPRPPVPAPPRPLRFTLVETEPDKEKPLKPAGVLSDADRQARSLQKEQPRDKDQGTGGRMTLAALARPESAPDPRPVLRPEAQEPEVDKRRQEVEPPVEDILDESAPDPERPMTLLETVFTKRPPPVVMESGRLQTDRSIGNTPGKFGPVQFDSYGFDFGPYARRIVEIVRKNWYSIMPWSAKWGAEGKVTLRFVIARDGSVSELELLSSSEKSPLDRAALNSIQLSSPLPRLPETFAREDVGVTFSYYYNIPVERDEP